MYGRSYSSLLLSGLYWLPPKYDCRKASTDQSVGRYFQRKEPPAFCRLPRPTTGSWWDRPTRPDHRLEPEYYPPWPGGVTSAFAGLGEPHSPPGRRAKATRKKKMPLS